YIASNDKAIYTLLCNYFVAIRETVWAHSGAGSYLFKTIGVQALFDVLRALLAATPITAANFSAATLTKLFQPCSNLDPDGRKYESSGIGRSAIRKDLLHALKLE